MLPYDKAGARAWAKAHLRGVINVTIPSFRSDLSGLNEAAIRHDIRTNLGYGFDGTLLVSEVAISLAEYEQFVTWARDEAGDGQILVHHAAFNTLEENIAAARMAERKGCKLVLLTYPPSLYAESEEDIYAYTKAFCDAVEIAVLLFPVPLWGFARVHPSDIPTGLIRRLLDACPNIVAIKAEGGLTTMGFVECYRLFSDEVVISMPLEGEFSPLAQLVPLQLSATSNHEYMGPVMPQQFKLLQEGRFDEATELFWRVTPARKANMAASSAAIGMGLTNRLVWKYQAWLTGYSGGMLRMPTMRVSDVLMGQLRQGLVKSGIDVTSSPDREFFVGRYPG